MPVVGVNGMRDDYDYAITTFRGLVGKQILAVMDKDRDISKFGEILANTRLILAFCYSQGLSEYKWENGGKGRMITHWVVVSGEQWINGQTGEVWISDRDTFIIKTRVYWLVDYTEALGFNINNNGKGGFTIKFDFPEYNDKMKNKHGEVFTEMLMDGDEFLVRENISYQLVGEVLRSNTIGKYACQAEEYALKKDEPTLTWDMIRMADKYDDWVEGEEIVYQGTEAM